jgi:hypothetical protein
MSNADIAGAAQSDCSRFTASYEFAQDWNNSQEAVTTYAVASDNSWSLQTTPDGTIHKQFDYTSGWSNGLTYREEVWSGGASYASSITYRAFGSVKAMNFAEGAGRSLATSYDNGLRPTKSDV